MLTAAVCWMNLRKSQKRVHSFLPRRHPSGAFVAQ
jgi:hypothetical protein